MSIIKGFTFSGIHCGIKKAKKDLALAYAQDGASWAAVTTQNKFAAAGVHYTRQLLASQKDIRAIVVNSGNANALTGKQGEMDIEALLKSLSVEIPISPDNSVLLSTGIIGKPLPTTTISSGFNSLVKDLSADSNSFAEAICTTDLSTKTSVASIQTEHGIVNILGIAKGSGMIQPNMATMLAFLFTDATISSSELRSLLPQIASQSFNRITVDSDASTNDTLMLLASNKGAKIQSSKDHLAFSEAVTSICVDLAKKIIQDGEGCTKFVELSIEKALSVDEARQIFFAIANSPLVKTALFGENPNFGRILCSAGKNPSSLVPEKVNLWLGPHQVVINGATANLPKDELDSYMKNKNLTIQLELNTGLASFTGWTTDLSYEYVKINAEYN